MIAGIVRKATAPAPRGRGGKFPAVHKRILVLKESDGTVATGRFGKICIGMRYRPRKWSEAGAAGIKIAGPGSRTRKAAVLNGVRRDGRTVLCAGELTLFAGKEHERLAELIGAVWKKRPADAIMRRWRRRISLTWYGLLESHWRSGMIQLGSDFKILEVTSFRRLHR